MAPRIQELLPGVSGAEPVGGTSPVLEAVGEAGRGVERFGRSVSEVADSLESRISMMESADAQAQVAEAKANFFDRVRDETNRGVLDQNKLFDDYDNWVNETADQFSTPRGRAEFERATGRTRGSLIRWSAQGAAEIAGANALADHTKTVNTSTNLVQKDPNSFPDAMHDLEQLYASYSSNPNMNKNPVALQKMKQADQARLAEAAVQGQMASDFDNIVGDMLATGGKVDPTNPHYNVAKGMLESGVYDDYLDANRKAELQKQIRSNFSAAQTEGQRVLNLKDAAKAQVTEDWEQQAIPKWTQNQLSVKDVINSPMDSRDKIRWINMIKEGQKKEIQTDPGVMNALTERILSPDNAPGHISDASQLSPYVGKGLTIPNYMQLKNLMTHSGQGEVDRDNEKQLIDLAKSKLVAANPMLGLKDPDGQYRLMLFTNALQQAKQQAIAEKRPVSSILDPNSKDFFGNRIGQYMPTAQEVLSRQANAARGEFTPPATVQTQPGVEPKPAVEETVTMFKKGVPRQIYKSKIKDAEAQGYTLK